MALKRSELDPKHPVSPVNSGESASATVGPGAGKNTRALEKKPESNASLHPFRKGHFLGSGQGEMVLAEAGLDGRSQYRAIKKYVEALRQTVKAPARPSRGASVKAAPRKPQPKGRKRAKK